MTSWPSQQQVLSDKSLYGNPRGRNGRPSPAWEKNNLTSIKPPFTMRYAGKPISSIRVHKKCAESLLRVLTKIWDASGRNPAIIKKWGADIYGGCYNFRLMRGGSKLSMHSYGCAIDLDPANNGLHDRTPKFANIPEVRNAFKSEGWTWGGDWDGDNSVKDERTPDGMHWQATQAVG